MMLTHELDIHVIVDDEEALVTSLYDTDGAETCDVSRAVVGVGFYLTGPDAGELFLIEEPRHLPEIDAFRLN